MLTVVFWSRNASSSLVVASRALHRAGRIDASRSDESQTTTGQLHPTNNNYSRQPPYANESASLPLFLSPPMLYMTGEVPLLHRGEALMSHVDCDSYKTTAAIRESCGNLGN